MQETEVRTLGWEDPLEKGMATHSSIFAWEIHGQRSLAGYSLRGCKELDVDEQLTHKRSSNLIENGALHFEVSVPLS